jgi:hypothetical protein
MKKRKPSELALIGSTDKIDLPNFELNDIPCKIDTGAFTSSIHCTQVRLIEKDEQTLLAFKLYDKRFGIKNKKEYRFAEFKERKVRSSNGELDYRYSIKIPVIIFGRKISTEFTLSYREKMKYPILLGKRFLRKRFIVDVSKDNLSFNNKTQA